MDFLAKPCTAFAGTRQVAKGTLVDVALALSALDSGAMDGPLLTFDDATGAVIDLDVRGTTAEIVARLTERGRAEDEPTSKRRRRGRPKLGVVAREVTLLPRHWDWLAAQPGGASAALRRLVEQARLHDGGATRDRLRQERTYRFLAALAGDLPGFEEATRALFAGDLPSFLDHMAAWPDDIRNHARLLAED